MGRACPLMPNLHLLVREPFAAQLESLGRSRGRARRSTRVSVRGPLSGGWLTLRRQSLLAFPQRQPICTPTLGSPASNCAKDCRCQQCIINDVGSVSAALFTIALIWASRGRRRAEIFSFAFKSATIEPVAEFVTNAAKSADDLSRCAAAVRAADSDAPWGLDDERPPAPALLRGWRELRPSDILPMGARHGRWRSALLQLG